MKEPRMRKPTRAYPSSLRAPMLAMALTALIATPAMIATWAFGLWMVWLIEAWHFGWFYAKFACVLALSGYHEMLGRFVKQFADDQIRRPARFFRIVNEVPTLLMIAIVILVIV